MKFFKIASLVIGILLVASFSFANNLPELSKTIAPINVTLD